jgi:hypothetical protein
MRRAHVVLAVLGLVALCFCTEGIAQELPYTEGSVWQVTFVRTQPGMQLKYLENLQANWKKVMDEGKKQGLILSYRILSGAAATMDDWDLMLMVEMKNMAMLDGLDDKFMEIEKKVVGSEEKADALMMDLSQIREIMGSKLTREVTLK